MTENPLPTIEMRNLSKRYGNNQVLRSINLSIWSEMSKGGNFVKGMLALMAIGAFGAGHYFLVGKTGWVLGMSAVVALACIPVYRSIRRTSWQQIQH